MPWCQRQEYAPFASGVSAIYLGRLEAVTFLQGIVAAASMGGAAFQIKAKGQDHR